MLEESVPAVMWASMSSWFTPTVLFVVLNIVIGTIAVTSKAHSNSWTAKSENEGGGDGYNHDNHPPLLTRGSSLLTRVKSMNFHRYVSSILPSTTETLELQPVQQRPDTTVTAETASKETTFLSPPVESEFETLEDAYSAAKGVDIRRSLSESETHPAAETKRKVAMGGRLMRKTASERKTNQEEFDADVVKRSTAVREEEKGEGSGEVDARADDFINRFRKQLQLQRLNSILRYKEMQQMNGKDH